MTTHRTILTLLPAAAVAAVPATAAARDEHDRSVLVRTAQSKPVKLRHGNPRVVVGQAAITRAGRLIVRLAVPARRGHGGERILAQTRHRIESAVSQPTKAKLTIELARRHAGTVTVIGPLNRSQPDAILYKLRWKAGPKPSIRIVSAHV